MSYNEADTRAKRIDPALCRQGWTEANIQREETVLPDASPDQSLGEAEFRGEGA